MKRISLLFSVVIGSAAACTSGGSPSGHGGAGGSHGSGDGGVVDRDDFPAPVLDNGAPNAAPTLFGQPDKGSGGPCLYEPELGSLFPNNWLRPRFRWTALPGQNLF